ncbi:MAG: Nif3-like dinuclear metal center hexameric protein [Sedimentisphaerales bacterium]|nr:Nif3-like dinuclear metal center hexameric protein [Sedimentisphaerales bacterium]
MKINDIAAKIEEIVPLGLAQDWDNVGLLIGDEKLNVKNILLTIDITKDVVAEAKRLKAQMIISYHPVIWDGLKKIVAAGATEVIYRLIREDISVFSIHTALDVAEGGVNDELAEMVGICDAKPIGDFVEDSESKVYKLAIFVPVEAAAKVSNALFAAGAGGIGRYEKCSFETEGIGSFLPGRDAKPAVGKRGRLEKVPEIRFETIVPAKKLDDCIAAMKKAHPYEMPAFDVIKLYNNRDKFGLGRIGNLKKPVQLRQIIEKIKDKTGAKAMGIVGRQSRIVRKAAVCAGSCGKIINAVIAAECDLYVTGELKHHQALAGEQADLTCICLSHTVSERFILKKLAKRLQKEIKNITIKISRVDSDPFIWKQI